jgi:glutathione synthase/RimK-type ligase-like ATP-grasp enzyme
MLVAIHPDFWDAAEGERANSSSPKYAAILQKAGHEVRWVDIFKSDIVSQVQGCHGFIWRHGHHSTMVRVAKLVLPVLERELGLMMYPDQRTCWHYDDKLAQKLLFEAHAVPAPKTWVFWDNVDAALEFARSAQYPLVLKLASGAASQNVRLLRGFDEAEPWIRRLMGDGAYNLDHAKACQPHQVLFAHHKNYVLLQEFLPENPFDTRITVIGNRAFGYRRFNRPNDFRASGSGLTDHNPADINPAAVRLALLAAQRLASQSLAFDIVHRGDEQMILEVSYTYVSWMVKDCPGHWEIDGDPETAPLRWVEGHVWPEEAQMADYLPRLEERGIELGLQPRETVTC